MYCPKCGKENSEGARFCMHCGADLSGYKVEISPNISVSPYITVPMMDKEQISLLVEDTLSKALEKTPVFKDIQGKKAEFTLEEKQVIDVFLKVEEGGYVSLSKYDPQTLERCADFFDELSEKRPEIKSGEWFWHAKGSILLGLGKHGEALEWWDKLLDRYPLSYAGWFNKGVVLEHLNRYDEAIRCFDKALEINQKIDDAWTEKGFLLGKKLPKLTEKLLEHKISAEEYESKRLKLMREAKRCINKALERNQKNERAWVLKSILESDKNERMRCINNALEINSKSLDTLCRMGEEKYLSAMVFGETNFIVGWDRGILWEAIEWFDKALKIDPYYTEALKRKENILKILKELP